MVDPRERLVVLLAQETDAYGTYDYLRRMQEEAAEATEPCHANRPVNDTEESRYVQRPDAQQQSERLCQHLPQQLQQQQQHQRQLRERPPVHEGSPHKKHKTERCGSVDAASTVARNYRGDYSANGNRVRDTRPIYSCVPPSSSSSASSSASTMVNRHWREKMCEWAYQVVDHFDMQREIVSVAMNYFDRYLGTCAPVYDKNAFQLLAMTCLNLAVKLYEYKYLLVDDSKSTMETILKLSRGNFSVQQMQMMEVDVLTRLAWRVHPPTPQSFVKYILYLCSWEQEVHDLSQFMVELSVIDYDFVKHRASDVAVAALLQSLDIKYRQHGPMERSVLMEARVQALRGLFDVECPGVLACRRRLSVIYDHAVVTHDSNSTTTAAPRVVSPVDVARTNTAQCFGGNPASTSYGVCTST